MNGILTEKEQKRKIQSHLCKISVTLSVVLIYAFSSAYSDQPDPAPSNSQLVQTLMEDLQSKKTAIRAEACWKLAKLNKNAEPAMPELLRLFMNDPSQEVHNASYYALIRIGDPVVPSVTALLKSKNMQLRIDAIKLLGLARRNSGRLVPELLPLLQDKNPAIREETIDALGKIRDKKAVPHLIDYLQKTNNYSHQTYTVGSLGEIGEAALPVAHLLIKIIKKDSPQRDKIVGTGWLNLSQTAANSLAQMGPKGIEHLHQLLKDPNQPAVLRNEVLYALQWATHLKYYQDVTGKKTIPTVWRKEVRKQILPTLLMIVKENDEKLDVTFAIKLIGMLGERGKTAIPLLKEVLTNDKTGFRRIYAASTLIKIDPVRTAEYVRSMAKGLTDPSEYARADICTRLYELKEKSAPAIPMLIKTLNDSNLRVRRLAIEALGEIGAAAKEALPKLQDLAKSKNAEISNAAKRSIEYIRNQR